MEVGNMTAEMRATAALHDTAEACSSSLYKVMNDMTAPMAAMMDASDIVAAIRACANLILAIEAIGDTASEEEKKLRAMIAETMNENGVPTIATEGHLISCYEPPPRAVVMNEGDIPPHFFIQPPARVDIPALTKALRDGPVSGATLTNGGAPVLRISTRKQKQ